MCGIAGVAGRLVTNESDRVLVSSMCVRMAHRGPDDQGVQALPEVVLGQARLSIIDPAGGHQPIGNETGDVWVTCNGEIYNFVELRDELRRAGHRFTTGSDSEVLVHLYEEHGLGMLDRLNGMFAFALWDGRTRTLHLARDRMGIKPLYYATLGDRIVFASEMKALLDVGAIRRDVDREAIAEYLVLNYITDPRTPFSAIRKLEPASTLSWCDGRIDRRRYWAVPLEGPADRPLDDLCEELRALLIDSVRLQLRSDVPVGVFASGGLDSTAIMWAASEQGISLDAFLAEFEGLSADTEYARLAARHTGMPLHEERIAAVDAGRLLPRLIWHADEPLADPAMLPCYLIAQTAARKVKVILNGTGGDELFGGYARYNLRGLAPAAWSAGAARLIRRAGGGGSFATRLGATLDYRERLFRRMAVSREPEVRSAMGLDPSEPVRAMVEALFAAARRDDAPGSMMHVEMQTYLPGDLFMMLDKMSMAASLEARVPLVDHRLVEFATRIPGRLRMRGGELKWLLRRALRGRVPDRILDRPKQGFSPPVVRWMNGPLGHIFAALLQAPGGRVAQLVGREWVRRGVQAVGTAGPQEARRLWSLAVLELWWRSFVDGEDPSLEELPGSRRIPRHDRHGAGGGVLFPPLGGGGVQRSAGFVKYLPVYGWRPVVLTVEPNGRNLIEQGRDEAALPPDASLEIIRTRSFEYAGLYTSLHRLRLRRLLFQAERWIPLLHQDYKIGWYRPGLAAAGRRIQSGGIDAVYTTSPPYSAHFIGAALSAEFGVPWVADFRDPWSGLTGYRPPTGLHTAIDRRLERWVLARADRVIANTPRNRADLVDAFGVQPDKVVVIPNGFDPADFGGAALEPASDRFRLVCVGKFYDMSEPEPFFRAFARFHALHPESELEMMGPRSRRVRDACDRLLPAGSWSARGRVPHSEAVGVMRSASALFANLPTMTEAHCVPGKLYEYLAAGRPVLFIGPNPGESAAIIEAAGAGVIADNSEGDVLAALERLHDMWLRNGEPHPDPAVVARYDRSAQAGVLAAVLNELPSRRVGIGVTGAPDPAVKCVR